MNAGKKFERFLDGFAAACQLRARAGSDGFAIEVLCLGFSIIDGLLRVALILQHQIDTKSSEFIEELLYQGDNDKIIYERAIFKRALDKEIIDDDIFKKLSKLYDDRNKVVHRYIISDITTNQVVDIAIEVEDIISVIKHRVREIEDTQIKLGVGITKSGKDQSLSEKILAMAERKHASDALSNAYRQKQRSKDF